MIDLDSAAAIARAAQFAHHVITAQIIAEPTSPLVTDLQRIADMAEQLVNENAALITSLESRIR